MRPYEVMIIFDAGLEEDSIRAILDRASEALQAGGGRVARVDRWGKRRFAYELKHRLEGYYVLVEATSDPAAMAQMDRVLSLADEVVRHKVIRLPESVAGRGPAPVPVPVVEAEPVTALVSTTEPTGA
ncbi:MAG: 30S ribosomal protein S6 [Acidimicrobiales bacterium]